MKYQKNLGVLLLVLSAFLPSYCRCDSAVPLDNDYRYFCRSKKVVELTGTVQRILSKKEAAQLISATLAQAASETDQTNKDKLLSLIKELRGCKNGNSPDACTAVSKTAKTKSSSLSSEIVDGTICSSEKSPVIPLVLFDSNGNAIGTCSGMLIQSKPSIVILTAAHCFNSEDGVSPIQVRAIVDKKRIYSQDFHLHQYFDSSLSPPYSYYDAAVILFTEQSKTTPLKRYSATADELTVPSRTAEAGYGRYSSNIPVYVGKEKLRAGYKYLLGSNSLQYITYSLAPLSGACLGDSGGPLLTRTKSGWRIIGITSAVVPVSLDDVCANGGYEYYTDLINSQDNISFVRTYVADF